MPPLRPTTALVVAAALILLAPSAHAATLNVDTIVDDVTKSACDDEAADDCSLRGAIAKANADTAHDVIAAPAGTYTLSNAAPCFFSAAAGDSVNGTPVIALCVNTSVDIVGAGASATIIHSNGMDRVLAVGKFGTMNISGVTISGGRGGFGFAIGGGGGINNHGTVTLSDSLVTNNRPPVGPGGGVYNLGTLTVIRSTITGNSTPQGGGGIQNVCCGGALKVTVIDSTISDNGAHNGGGISNNGFVTIIGSTLARNTANVGGGIYNGGGQVAVLNSTISGNSALAGGIDNGRSSVDGHSLLRLENVTIANNTGTGLEITGTNQPVTVRNTIIAGNTNNTGSPDCIGKFISQGYNLLTTTGPFCQITGDTTGNILGQPARLGALANNGGLTHTHGLLGAVGGNPASPAIDAGNPADPGSGGNGCPALDQRGVLRPVGVRCDIGAFERGATLAITEVSPPRAGNAGPLAVIVAGSGFEEGATVKLTRTGETDIAGTPVNVESAGASLATSFDLEGRALGAWDVVVTNLGGETATLPAAFTVEQTRAPDLWADVIGRLAIRAGRPVRFTVIFGNRGNVDAVGVPLSLVIPKTFLFDALFQLVPPPASPSQAIEDFSLVPIVANVDPASELTSIPLLLPVVPAGFVGTIDFTLELPAGIAHGATFLVAAKIEPVEPWFTSDATLDATVDGLVAGARAYAERAFGTTVPAMVDAAAATYARAQLEAIAAAGRAEIVARLGQTGALSSPAQIVIDVAAFMAEQATARPRWQALDTLLAFVAQGGVTTAEANTVCRCICGQIIPEGCSCPATGCEKPYAPPNKPPNPGGLTPGECKEFPNHKVSADGTMCIPSNADNCPRINLQNPFHADYNCLNIPILQAVDPNEKTPSPGVGPTHVVTGDQPLKYAVSFENKPDATAPAQIVEITDQLDTASLDLSTFSFGPIAIGDAVTILPPPGSQDFTGGADLRPANDIIVSVHAHLDTQTGLVTWTFTSLDPATGQLTNEATAGFLPPNTNPPDGEGRVFYTVSAKPSVATGTVIKNKASIVFDVNAPIETAEVSNTIDKTPPTSAVTSIVADSSCDRSLQVSWSGTDAESTVLDYSVFVSENGGAFTLWKEKTADTTEVFDADVLKTYAFYTTARDAVGHVEAPSATADASHAVGICGTEHDLAITKLKVPKTAKLTEKKPSRTVAVTVEIQNRSRHNETIPDVATLASLVDLTVDSLGACADPVATFRPPKKPKVISLKPAKKLKLVFDVTIDCANAPLKGALDYTFQARVDHTPLGDADAHPADDVCPRDIAPPGVVDPIPTKPILDKGCGTKKPDKTFGGVVSLDVIRP